MNFLDEAVYNVKKGNMPPDPSTLDKDDIVNIGEKKLDPVGQEDDDINNDGKVDSTDKYLANKRKAIAKAILKSKKTIKKEDLEEGKLANALGGAAILASLLLIGRINSNDKVVQRLKAEYEQAEPAQKDSIQKLLTKRLIFLDTGEFDDSTPMDESIGKALDAVGGALVGGLKKFLSGEKIDFQSIVKGFTQINISNAKEREQFESIIKIIEQEKDPFTKEDPTDSKTPAEKIGMDEATFMKLLKKASAGPLNATTKEDVNKVIKALETVRQKRKEAEAAAKKATADAKDKEQIKGAGGKTLVDPSGKPITRGSMKEAKDIKLPPDTVFKLDLKHLTKKHMEKGHSKEKAIEITKRLMKKLHNKGKIEVDGQEIKFIKEIQRQPRTSSNPILTSDPEKAKKPGYRLVTQQDIANNKDLFNDILDQLDGADLSEADLDIKDMQMSLPQPDAPDYLGDDGMDYEGGMAKSQMLKMKKYAVALCDMIEDESQLESWVQAKLTKASDYMSSVYHYLDYQRSKMNESMINGKKVDLKSLEGEDNMFTYAEFIDGTKLTDDELDQLSDDSDALDTYFGPGGVGHIPRSDFM